MLLNYIKIAFRNLVRHKLYTLINVLGLAIGIGFCVLVMLFVIDEHSFDNFHPDGDQLYRVLTAEHRPDGSVDVGSFQPMPLIEALLEEYPEIASGVRFLGGSAIVSDGQKVFREEIAFTDQAAFSMFSFPLVAGDTGFTENGIYLTESSAGKYFGEEGAIGRRLTAEIRGRKSVFLVTGVLKDVPRNSSLKFDFLLPVSQHGMYEQAKDRWTSYNGSAYVKLAPGTDPVDLARRFAPFIAKHFGSMIQREQTEGRLAAGAEAYGMPLQPIRNIHLEPISGFSMEESSDPAYSYILGAIALFVLMIACINFTTLAIGRSAGRAREVGVRKVLGAVRTQLMKQFWGETFLLCLISLGAGIVIAEFTLPAFNEMTGKSLDIGYLSQAWLFAGIALLLVLVGLVAGGYPAVFLSKFEPVEVLKGRFRFAGRTPITRILVVVQFVLSTVLIVSTIIMSDQMRYLLSRDLGYSGEQVVVVQLYDGRANPGLPRLERLKTMLAAEPAVLGVSGTNAAFTHGFDINGFQYQGQHKTASMYRVDERFLEVLGITLGEGRNFNPANAWEGKNAVIVNEALARDFGWTGSIIGRRLSGWNEASAPGGPEVIGVVRDFNFGSLRDDIRPAVLFTDPDWGMDQALIKLAPAKMAETMERIRDAWAEIAPDKPFEATFLNEDVQKQYELELRWMGILRSGSAMAIALACLGLFGLAGLSVVNRTKEIGIRKVLGASVTEIVAMLSKEFAFLVVVANLIAVPLALYAATEWLDSYAYRIDLGPMVFLAGGLGALAIALATVSLHAVRAARRNPVHALRYE